MSDEISCYIGPCSVVYGDERHAVAAASRKALLTGKSHVAWQLGTLHYIAPVETDSSISVLTGPFVGACALQWSGCDDFPPSSLTVTLLGESTILRRKPR